MTRPHQHELREAFAASPTTVLGLHAKGRPLALRRVRPSRLIRQDEPGTMVRAVIRAFHAVAC
jgi:hypothetical protein